MNIYKKMMIKKSNIMPLIERLAKAYNKADGEFVTLENTQDSWFVLFDEEDKPHEVKPKPKCGDCKYLNLEDKHVVGYKCHRPNFHRTFESASWKQKCNPGCKAFERREEWADIQQGS